MKNRSELAGTEVMKWMRRTVFNPIRTLTPAGLVRDLEAFEYGDLRNAAMLWEAIARRDDLIPGVKGKREKAISQLPWQVLTLDDSPEAMRQKAVLEHFYNNLTATNAYDHNERGGFARLIRQMMTAVSYRYAVHHIVWHPDRRETVPVEGAPNVMGISATLEFVPLYFFENTTGRLRFVESGTGRDGKDLADGEWMVTTGDGIMTAVSVAYTLKRLAHLDWNSYSERFGTPGVLGRTSASKDSEAGIAMAEAVEAFGNEFKAVVYGDDTGKSGIELVEAKSSGEMPMPKIIERLDRMISALYRGADLSTMSAGDGDGSGASLQGDEADLLAADDAQMVTEALNNYLDRAVIDYTFGRRAKALAYVQVAAPVRDDMAFKRDTMTKLVEMGAQISVSDAMEMFGFSPADDDEPVLTPPATAQPMIPNRVPVANAKVLPATERAQRRFLGKSRDLLGAAADAALRPMMTDLQAALAGPDADFLPRLRAIQNRIPDYLRAARADGSTEAAFEKIFAAAFLNGATEDQP